jgi:hypothetical protein
MLRDISWQPRNIPEERRPPSHDGVSLQPHTWKHVASNRSLEDVFEEMQQEVAVAQFRQATEICLEGLIKTTKNFRLNGVMPRNLHLKDMNQRLCRMIGLAQLVRLLRYEFV